jgi:NitT/TauT family transport system permease protein
MTLDIANSTAPRVEPDPPIARGSTRMGPRAYRLLVWTIRLAIVGVFLGAWQAYGTESAYTKLVIGSPDKIAGVLRNWVGTTSFWDDLRTTLTEAGLGYLLGGAVAVATVAVVVAVPLLDRFLSPFISLLNALPKVALAPLFLVWFGINVTSKVYFVASLIYFIIFYGIYSALNSIDQTLLDNTRALGASRIDLVVQVYIPAIVSWITSSLRLGGAFALLAAVFAEILGSNGGIGDRISQAQQALMNNDVMAGVFVIAIVALLLDRVLVFVEHRFDRWRAF